MSHIEKLKRVQAFARELGLQSDFYQPIVLVTVPPDGKEEGSGTNGCSSELPLADREEGRPCRDGTGKSQGLGEDAGGGEQALGAGS